MKDKRRAIAKALALGAIGTSTALAATVTSIDFSGIGNDTEIKITADGPVTFQKEEGDANQLVLKLDAPLSKPSERKIDTSSFEASKVKLISPYNVEGGSKIVVQLKDAAASDVSAEGNVIRVKIPNAGTAQAAAPAPGPEAPSEAAPPATHPEGGETSEVPGEPVTDVAKSPRDTGTKDAIDQFMQSRETRRFSGSPITLKVRDADLTDVFRLIGETSGFSIVMNENVKGKVTLAMENVPWDQVLDVVLRTHQLGAERNGNLLRIATLTDLTAEKNQELQAKRAAQSVAPRITRIFQISYASLEDITKILTNFANSSSGSSTGGAQGGGAEAPLVQADKRTNQIVVRDIAENIERMRKLIELLDTQTPQVMIEAKVIEATEEFSKNIGGNLGVSYQNATTGGLAFANFNGSNPFGSLTGTPGVYQNPGPISPGSAGQGAFGLSPRFGFLPGVTLNALLNLAESENNVKVVASPKSVVLDREQANILQSQPVLVPATSTAVAGVGTTSGVEIKQANLSLQVTPSVTNEGSVLMQLNLSRDMPVPVSGGNGTETGIAQRNMTTRVLVDSGSTLVIGGVYTMGSTHTSAGFPILRKIPLIGGLFGTEQNRNNRSELFFFITPRILNPREAGLGG